MTKTKRVMGTWLSIVGAALITFNGANAAEPLVDVTWLTANKGKVIVLDVQAKEKNFLSKGHIPGAVLVPWSKVRAKAKEGNLELIKMMPSKASFARLMKVSGVNDDSHIVVTSSGTSSKDLFLGTRLYWQLKYFGHDEVSLLNGGNAAWVVAKQKLSTSQEVKPQAGNFTVRAERKALLSTTADVQKLVEQGSQDLIDARTLDYHLGLEQKTKYVYAAGHIPGSKMVPHDILVQHGPAAKFRSVDQIKATLGAMGVNMNASNVAYCNSGHLGSGLWFVLHELAGNTSAKLYDGSMHAWTKDNKNPVVVSSLN